MSTKISLKHRYENRIGGYHLYRECLEEDEAYVYLEVDGVPFKAANSAYIDGDEGLSSIAFRLPIAWARELGLVENPPEVIPEKIIRRSPLMGMIEEPDGKDNQAVRQDLVENPPAPKDMLKGAIRALMDNDIQATEGDRNSQSQKLAAWFLAPNGWIPSQGPDGPRPVAPIDALDRPEDVINALKKRQGTHDA